MPWSDDDDSSNESSSLHSDSEHDDGEIGEKKSKGILVYNTFVHLIIFTEV